MLPVVAGPAETRRQIVLYSWALVPLATLPAFMGFAGNLYLVTSVISGAIFLYFADKVRRVTEGREGDHAAKQLFLFSILYLFLLFVVLLGEHAWQRLMG